MLFYVCSIFLLTKLKLNAVIIVIVIVKTIAHVLLQEFTPTKCKVIRVNYAYRPSISKSPFTINKDRPTIFTDTQCFDPQLEHHTAGKTISTALQDMCHNTQ